MLKNSKIVHEITKFLKFKKIMKNVRNGEVDEKY